MADRAAALGSRSAGSGIGRVRHLLGRLVAHLLLIVAVIVFLAPVIGVVATSFKTIGEISRDGVWSLPAAFRVDNFLEAITGGKIGIYLLNSVLVTIPATVLSIAFGVLLGYVFSQFTFRGREPFFVVVIAGMFFPPQIVLIPLFELFNAVGLYNTLWPLIIVHVAFGIPICTLLMRNFLGAVPSSMREAAIVDGATEVQVLWRVILPIALPAVAVLATLQFTWIWNDFLWPLVLTRSNEARTIMAGIVSLKGQYDVVWGVQAAMALIASLPTVLVFVFFQRYFIRGLTLGAVKE